MISPVSHQRYGHATTASLGAAEEQPQGVALDAQGGVACVGCGDHPGKPHKNPGRIYQVRTTPK
jgi:hypothetical protein